MTDLLTHILVGYLLGTVLTVVLDRSQPGTTVVMIGAILPDLTKIAFVIPDASIERLLGLLFSWEALHTLGGVLVTAAVGGLLLDRTHRRTVVALLLVGAVSHLFLDALLIKPSGYASALWWPFTAAQFPTPGLYVSSDRWPAVVAGAAASSVYMWTAYLSR
jgi:membrane-bound metal-dependent hydrolase YbcI (DUF457 family)